MNRKVRAVSLAALCAVVVIFMPWSVGEVSAHGTVRQPAEEPQAVVTFPEDDGLVAVVPEYAIATRSEGEAEPPDRVVKSQAFIEYAKVGTGEGWNSGYNSFHSDLDFEKEAKTSVFQNHLPAAGQIVLAVVFLAAVSLFVYLLLGIVEL